MASSLGMSARATSSDQRSPRDKLAAPSILSGGIRRGSSFLKPPRSGRRYENGDAAAQRFGSQRALRRIRIDLDGCGALPRLDVKESCGRHLGAREIRDPAVRRKRKARHALSTKGPSANY